MKKFTPAGSEVLGRYKSFKMTPTKYGIQFISSRKLLRLQSDGVIDETFDPCKAKLFDCECHARQLANTVLPNPDLIRIVQINFLISA